MEHQDASVAQLEQQLTQAEMRVTELQRAERDARRVTECSQAVGLALTQTFDLDTILESLLDHLGQLVPYDSATIFMLEQDTRLVARTARGYERWVKGAIAIQNAQLYRQSQRELSERQQAEDRARTTSLWPSWSASKCVRSPR